MIKKIYSKIKPEVLLSLIQFYEPNSDGISSIKRTAITDPEHFLQVMSFEMPFEANIKAHKHNPQERKTSQTHEACLVFKGSIELSVYDIDNNFVEKLILKEGDCSIILNGGHSIKTLAHSQIFEFKNGPYNGAEKDKTNLE